MAGRRLAVALLFVLFLLAGVARAADPIVVDHRCTDIWQIPDSAILQAKAKLHIAYGHTSHGSQLIAGMGTSGGAQLDAFMTANGATSGLYLWNAGGTNGALDLRDRAFSGASDLGNPNRTAWEAATRTWLAAHAETNVIIWSWCGQADTPIANIDIYLNLMEGLIADFPAVQFVFMTGHLTGSGVDGTLNRANEHIRHHCRTNGRVLYDFADIESFGPDGQADYMRLSANDNCDYDSDGNGSRDRNWAVDWQISHTEGVDWWASGAAHSQHLNGNRKGYAAWWLWAKLAGWESDPVDPPDPEPDTDPAPKLSRAVIDGGKKQTGYTIRIDGTVKGDATGCRVWEVLDGIDPPDFTSGAPIDGVYSGMSLSLSAEPGLPAKRRVCVQVERNGKLSKIRTMTVRLVPPKVRKVVVQGGKKRTDPALLLDLLVKRDVVAYRVWEDLPGAVPPEFTSATPVENVYAGIPLTLSSDPDLPRRRIVLVQVTGVAVASKTKRVIVTLR